MVGINYSDKIPNNVNLDEDPRLQRALESWQPEFLNWWKELGPFNALKHDVYLRTAVSVEPSGWAHFDYVNMPEYRWGIFLAPAEQGRQINFGKHKGRKVEDIFNSEPQYYDWMMQADFPLHTKQKISEILNRMKLQKSGLKI